MENAEEEGISEQERQERIQRNQERQNRLELVEIEIMFAWHGDIIFRNSCR